MSQWLERPGGFRRLPIGAADGVIMAVFKRGWARSVIGLQTTLPVPGGDGFGRQPGLMLVGSSS